MIMMKMTVMLLMLIIIMNNKTNDNDNYDYVNHDNNYNDTGNSKSDNNDNNCKNYTNDDDYYIGDNCICNTSPKIKLIKQITTSLKIIIRKKISLMIITMIITDHSTQNFP